MSAHYDEKRKTWYCKLKYTDWQGRKRSTVKRGFARKKDALQYEHDFKSQSQEKASITLAMLAEKYLEDYKLSKKESSYKVTSTRIKQHILPYFANVKIENITPYRIKQWQNELAKNNYSPSMTRIVNTAFSALLNYGVKYFNLPKNPFSITKKTGQIKKKTDFWEVEDFEKAAPFFTDPFDNVVFTLLFWSGMRIGELLALTADDFDFNHDIITISKSYSHLTKKISTPKTSASNRSISIPAAVMALAKDLFTRLETIPQYPFLLHPPAVYRARLARYAEQAGVKRITLHDLRHSHASFLIRHTSASLPLIAKRLGHSSPVMTLNVYAHVYKDNDSELISEIDGFIKRGSKGGHGKEQPLENP